MRKMHVHASYAGLLSLESMRLPVKAFLENLKIYRLSMKYMTRPMDETWRHYNSFKVYRNGSLS